MINRKTRHAITAAPLLVALVLPPSIAGAAKGSWGGTAPEATGIQLELIEAIKARDKNAFDAALDAGADPSSVAVIEYGAWALCKAAEEYDPYFLDRLLELGADPNAYSPNRSVYDETALACALGSGNDGAVRTLDAAGADDSVVMCPDCREPATPFSVALSATKWFALEIMERRELTSLELEDLQEDLRFSHFGDKTYKGVPMRRYFEGYLTDRGVEPLPERRKEREAEDGR